VKRIAVLGAGLVGGLIVRDLAEDPGFEVTVADRSGEALGRLAGLPRVSTRRADLSDPAEVVRIASGADAVVGAVPGFLGTGVLRAALEAGRPVADIAFSPEDPFDLGDLARSRGVPAVVDCGVAPGISNLLVGRAAAELSPLEEVVILVGGLPFRRVLPFEYRAVFSPTDVVEEYTRPCRYRENGREVVKEALTDRELVDVPVVGTLEAFNTDGLRTLLRTIDAPTLKEKTLRYPGHASLMAALRDTGFLDREAIPIGDARVAPRSVTEALLFRAWALPEGEEEFTVLRVRAVGRAGGRRVQLTWDLFDRTDLATGSTSMARTTGFPCAVVARWLAEGRFRDPGVHPPELLGRDPELAAALLQELERRNVRVRREEAGLE
jgi:lysine 6-dehydrogenase